eukprot:g9011.t1
MKTPFFLTALLVATLLQLNDAKGPCKKHEVDFIMLEGDATILAIEDDIRADLEKVGFVVKKRVLPKKEFNKEMVAGNFNFAFSETWGPPYDPHSYAKSWSTTDEAYYAALKGLPEPNTKQVLNQKIDDVLKVESPITRQEKWREILNILHASTTELPFSGKRIPAVINTRLSSYTIGLQQFDYPVHSLRVQSGSKNISVAPGGQTGLFAGIGRLDPHSYRPNEFFANNWVYDGLVEYGRDGTILPSLATSWTVEDITNAGQKYKFNLREGVKFHDGATWNCAAAKLNFDHVLAPPLTTPDWHGWYGLPSQIKSWTCLSTYVFQIETKDKYYPLLQELTYIRPLRMLSPNKFVGGNSSNPLTQNSCPTGWGNITGNSVTLECAGITGISGTGRWKYIKTVKDANDKTQEVLFERNKDHWEPVPTNAVDFMRLVYYKDHSAVKDALVNNNLDAVIGAGVLNPADIGEFERNGVFKQTDGSLLRLKVYLSEPLQNRIVIINTAKAPTNDLKVRKVMVHAVDKASIISKELGSLAKPVNSLFPKSAPYCDVDLTPRWDYDLEKAELLNCPALPPKADDTTAIIVVLAILLALVVGISVFMTFREKQGRPLFTPLLTVEDSNVVKSGQVELPKGRV